MNSLALSFSCLIARNLLGTWKTCLDVFMYMNSPENEQSSQAADSTNSLVEGYKVDGNDTKVSIFSWRFPCLCSSLPCACEIICYGIWIRVKELEEDQGFWGEEIKFASSSIVGSLLDITQSGREYLRRRICHAYNTIHAPVNLPVGRTVHAFKTGPVVKNIAGELFFPFTLWSIHTGLNSPGKTTEWSILA